jgi:hypothetical protein
MIAWQSTLKPLDEGGALPAFIAHLTMLDASFYAILAGALAVAVAECRGADTTMTVPRYRQSPKFGVVQFEQVQTKLVRLVGFVEVGVKVDPIG